MMVALCALLFTTPLSFSVSAAGNKNSMDTAHYVYPLGKTVGIKLFSEGVLVIGLSDIKTDKGPASPAKACGLKEGDIITHINGKEVNSIEEVQSLLQRLAGKQMSVQVLRGENSSQLTTRAEQCASDGAYKLGAWIRDSMAGIGTVTFYDPESNIFGTLGHGINDIDTALLMPLLSGSIMPSSVSDVKKGLAGQPGELHGTFQLDEDIGTLYANTKGGVFGTLCNSSIIAGCKLMPIAHPSEVNVGKATILCNIAGDQVESFEVEISKLFPNAPDTRDLMLHVTDPRLLNATGGIVQGMSGSPIIQNGKLIGAVTHVLVNDPTKGYGILAEHMLAIGQAAQA